MCDTIAAAGSATAARVVLFGKNSDREYNEAPTLPAMPPNSMDIKNLLSRFDSSLARYVHSGMGFSFAYGGDRYGPAGASVNGSMLTTSVHQDAEELTIHHRDGLIVRRTSRVLKQFDAVEYTLHFKNASNVTLNALSDIRSLDIEITGPHLRDYCLLCCSGDASDAFFPPSAFCLRRVEASLTSEHGSMVELGTAGGRSSQKDLPLFIIHSKSLSEGAIVGFGWSGQWELMTYVDRTGERFTTKGRIPNIDLRLAPGEEIEGPTVLVGFYKGRIEEGCNKLRRLIVSQYTPPLGGTRFKPVATYDTWFGNIGVQFDEGLLRRLVDGAASIGQEYFLLDAGWYEGTQGNSNFSAGLGNWYHVDRGKLPSGLAPIAAHVRSQGMHFGLWFEPERVAPGSVLASEHPDWILWSRREKPDSWWKDAYPGFYKTNFGLLNFGMEEARSWVAEMIGHYIEEYDLRYVRVDFNMDPLSFWDENDPPGRRGSSQLSHIHGLYLVIDRLRNNHPNTIFDGCSSGGRRIDLQMIKRFHTFWISDSTSDSAINLFHLLGVSSFLPGYCNYRQKLYYNDQRPFNQHADLSFMSLFAGALGIGGRVDELDPEDRRKALMHVGVWKELRKYLLVQLC